MSQLIQKAILKMVSLHDGQVRKGDNKTPYAVHPLEVAIILSRYTPSEELIAAALLHDALEDTGYTFEQLSEEFGEGVAYFVSLLTEDKSTQDYWQRKINSLNKANEHKTAKVIKSIDTLVNMKDLVTLIQEKGEKAWQVFNGSKEMKVNYFKTILESWKEEFPPELLVNYVSALKDLEHAENQATGSTLGFNQ